MSSSSSTPADASSVTEGEKVKFLSPFLIGMVLDLFLCGVIIPQLLRWVPHAKSETTWTKVTVYSCVLFGVGFSIYTIYFSFGIFVYDFGPNLPFVNAKTLQPFILIDMGISILAQVFYTMRAFRLLNRTANYAKWTFVILLGLLIATQLVGAIATIVIDNLYTPDLLANALKARVSLSCWRGGQAAADVLITGATSYALWKSKTGWSGTDRVIQRLIRFTFETQLAPTLIAVTFIIYFGIHPRDTVIVALNFIMAKPYVIGLLAMLNAKDSLRRDIDQAPDSFEFKLSPSEGRHWSYAQPVPLPSEPELVTREDAKGPIETHAKVYFEPNVGTRRIGGDHHAV